MLALCDPRQDAKLSCQVKLCHLSALSGLALRCTSAVPRGMGSCFCLRQDGLYCGQDPASGQGPLGYRWQGSHGTVRADNSVGGEHGTETRTLDKTLLAD